MPKAKSHPLTEILPDAPQSNAQYESEAKYVKIIVFDNQNRILVVKAKSRFVLPGGHVEWDDDDTEAAARREVVKAANVTLGIVKPTTVIKTKPHQNQSTRTTVFVARLCGEDQQVSNKHRFMNKSAFFEASASHDAFVHSLVEAAHRVLVSEEIRNEHNQEIDMGRVLVASRANQ